MSKIFKISLCLSHSSRGKPNSDNLPKRLQIDLRGEKAIEKQPEEITFTNTFVLINVCAFYRENPILRCCEDDSVPYLLQLATIRHCIFVTIRLFESIRTIHTVYLYYSLFAIRDYSLFAIRDYSLFGSVSRHPRKL